MVKKTSMISCIFLLICCCLSTIANVINLQPKQRVNAETLGWSFRSNRSSSDHFKLLERDGRSLLVGARDAVYNLTMDRLVSQKVLEWPSTDKDVRDCRMKGKLEEDCHNYVRVLTKQSNGRVLVCGTNSYNPRCHQYMVNEDNKYQKVNEFSGSAISPYDPRHNSTALYLSDSDELYSGTVSDFTGSDSLIYRKSVSGPGSSELRTQRNSLKHLNDPNFVSVVDDSDAVYFMLRETAIEHNSLGKATYARVARVCKRDQGGARVNARDTWTTFLKARLNCSLPGNIPFYFDELQATTTLFHGQYGKEAGALIYAVFTTPHNGLYASAVCAFRLQDFQRTFDEGAFKAQATQDSLWLPIPPPAMPAVRPGRCNQDSKQLPDESLMFIQKNSLMEDAVSNFFNEPLLVDSSLRLRFTQIAVHNNVRAVNGAQFDVVFIGTNDGQVMKIVNTGSSSLVRTVLVETINVFSSGQAIKNLLVDAPELVTGFVPRQSEQSDGHLIVVSQDEVKAIPLQYCNNRTSCSGCVRLQDPYCAWDSQNNQCVGRTNGNWDDQNFIQSVETGVSASCPDGGLAEDSTFMVNELNALHVSGVNPGVYSAESMAVAVIATLAVATVLGFFVGYRFSHWRMSVLSEYGSSTSSSTSYGNHANIDMYHDRLTSSKLKVNDSVNLMLSLTDGKSEKHLLPLNNGTLPKDYKVKRVYL